MRKHTKILCAGLLALTVGMQASAELQEEMKADLNALADKEMKLSAFASYCVDYFELYGIPTAENTFRDIPAGDPDAENVLRLVGGGYLYGYGDGTVGYADIVSKERAYTILSRIIAERAGDKTAEKQVKAPNVTADMCTPSFWLSKWSDTEKVLLSPEEIRELNRRTFQTEETCTTDLGALPETFDGVYLADALADFKVSDTLYLDGKEPVGEEYYDRIKENIKGAAVSDKMPLRYGFAVNRTLLKAYPYADNLSDMAGDPEWDQFVNTGIYLNEPLALYFATADGKYIYAASMSCYGWIPAEDVAFCEDKAEWEKLSEPEEFLVVTGEKVYLEHSADADISGKVMTMGTVLPLSGETDGKITYRLAWNNYVVKIPCRDADGKLYYKNALIPANRDVHVGFLPYTTGNIVRQAFKCLGNRYGWGGMLLANDCSAFVKEVYKCFGLDLPRNDVWQTKMPVRVIDIGGKTAAEKKAILDGVKPGAILRFPGHIMMYLGCHEGFYYTINNVSSLVSPENPEGGVIRPRSVIVNDLSTQRASKTTWLDNLDKIIIISEK